MRSPCFEQQSPRGTAARKQLKISCMASSPNFSAVKGRLPKLVRHCVVELYSYCTYKMFLIRLVTDLRLSYSTTFMRAEVLVIAGTQERDAVIVEVDRNRVRDKSIHLLGVTLRVLDDTHTSASSAYVIQNEASQETQTLFYLFSLCHELLSRTRFLSTSHP